MPIIEEGHFISSQLEELDIHGQVREMLLTVAFGADATRSGNRFAALVRRRYRKTAKINATVAGEMVDDLDMELVAAVTHSGIEVVGHRGTSRYPYDSIGNRDGDFINGVFYGQMKSKRFRNRLVKGGVRLNRHHRFRIEKFRMGEIEVLEKMAELNIAARYG